MTQKRVRRRWPHRWGIAKVPPDASTEFDDAAYDGGVSGGAYTRHIVLAAVVIALVAGLWAWASGQG